MTGRRRSVPRLANEDVGRVLFAAPDAITLIAAKVFVAGRRSVRQTAYPGVGR